MGKAPERGTYASFDDRKMENAEWRVGARDSILALLSEMELGYISTAIDAKYLEEGEEYIDLEQLTLGIRKSDGRPVPGGRRLRKRAVREQIWYEALRVLLGQPSAASVSGRATPSAMP